MQGFTTIVPTIAFADFSVYKDKFIRKAELEKVLGRDVVLFRDADEMMDKIFNIITSGATYLLLSQLSEGSIMFTWKN